MIIGFIEHIQIASINNNSVIANSLTLQFTAARAARTAAFSPVIAW
jgi:hypothetical protein